MVIMYYLLLDPINQKVGGILRADDQACIPLDPRNTAYQQYLEWLDEGNTPEPWNPEQENN